MAQPRRNDFLVPTLGVLLDGIAIEAAFLLSYWLRFRTDLLSFLPLSENVPSLDAYVFGSFFVIPLWLLLFNSRKMYGARRNADLTDEFFAVAKLVTWGMLIVMSAAFFYRAFSYSRVVFGLLWFASIFTIYAGRILLVAIEKMLYRKGKELRNAVIVGGDETASRVSKALNNHPLLGYRFVGYFAEQESARGEPVAELPYLGKLSDAPAILSEHNIELALMALRYHDHPRLVRLVQECEGMNIEIMMVPDILSEMGIPTKIGMKEIEGIPFIRLKGVPMTTWGRIAKRTFDIVFSFIFLLLISPLLLLIAAAIKIGSRGPVFFSQERLGIDGKRFMIWKFRSMRMEAEKATGPVWASQEDPRRTGVGKILRKLSLDEMPQLLNVLKGEMSIVGPRPERPYFVEQFKGLVPKYLDRHRVKTGMTGWAQVNGLRGNTSLEKRIKYDIYYIENWSVGFDIKILLRTAGALFRTKNAI